MGAVLGAFGFAEKAGAAEPPPLEISAWIPYWKKASGTPEVIANISIFKEISPFGFTVKQDGTLFDASEIDKEPWPELFSLAKENKVKIFPTVMWSNGVAIDRVLRNPKLRKAHIEEIVRMVNGRNFDGVDIDYEGKLAKTKNYFSLFLKELYQAMGKKFVSCTIEARTPLSSRYDTIPKTVEYANDFVAINKYCDRVRIMAYDQGSIDIRLNALEDGPYVPVADPRWVEKAVKEASKTISKKKIVIGVPTYGYEYEVTPLSYGYRYDKLWSFNPRYALELADSMKTVPERNSAGEKSFMYIPYIGMEGGIPVSHKNLFIATAYAMATASGGSPNPFRILWWSDASAIKDKMDLARKLGVRGVAIFKIDGGQDPEIWNVLR